MITTKESEFNNQNAEENEITSENITPNSQDEKEEVITKERSYLSADDVVTTEEKLAKLNEQFPDYDRKSRTKEWIDSCCISKGPYQQGAIKASTIRELREALSTDRKIAQMNDFLENQQQQLIAAKRNKKLQNYHAALVIEYTKRLGGSTGLKEGEKLEPPIAVKRVFFNI